MKQQDKNLQQPSFKATISEFIQRTILALGVTALLAVATGAYANMVPLLNNPIP